MKIHIKQIKAMSKPIILIEEFQPQTIQQATDEDFGTTYAIHFKYNNEPHYLFISKIGTVFNVEFEVDASVSSDDNVSYYQELYQGRGEKSANQIYYSVDNSQNKKHFLRILKDSDTAEYLDAFLKIEKNTKNTSDTILFIFCHKLNESINEIQEQNPDINNDKYIITVGLLNLEQKCPHYFNNTIALDLNAIKNPSQYEPYSIQYQEKRLEQGIQIPVGKKHTSKI